MNNLAPTPALLDNQSALTVRHYSALGKELIALSCAHGQCSTSVILIRSDAASCQSFADGVRATWLEDLINFCHSKYKGWFYPVEWAVFSRGNLISHGEDRIRPHAVQSLVTRSDFDVNEFYRVFDFHFRGEPSNHFAFQGAMRIAREGVCNGRHS